MTIIYDEYDTTVANLVTSLTTKITAHPDWTSKAADVQPETTLTASAASSATVFTVASTAHMAPGQHIVFNPGTGTEKFNRVTTINSDTSFSIASTQSTAYASGVIIRNVGHVLQCTTTRGAQMNIDLLGGPVDNYRMQPVFYQSYTDAATKVGRVDRYLYWRQSGGASTDTLHITLSVGKEHLFVSIEGPRAHEPGTYSTSYGSHRQYLFMSDLIPYHSNDTVPVVVEGAGTIASAAATVNSQSHLVDVSRHGLTEEYWPSGRLASLSFVGCQTVDTVPMPRDCEYDGNKYLFPYVFFSNDEGIRGRLARFFFAGTTHPTPYDDYGAPVGEKVTYDGIVYKLLAVNKSAGDVDAWGGFGAADNSPTSTIFRTVVVAVPFAEATP